jgi:hypothetical protein
VTKSITEPGGYLQWVELGGPAIPDLPEYPELYEINEQINKFWLASGFSENPLKVLMEKEAPPSLVPTMKRYDYPWNAAPELIKDATRFIKLSHAAMVPAMLYRTQQVSSMEEGAKRAQKVAGIIDEVPNERLVAKGLWSAMIAQKKDV